MVSNTQPLKGTFISAVGDGPTKGDIYYQNTEGALCFVSDNYGPLVLPKQNAILLHSPLSALRVTDPTTPLPPTPSDVFARDDQLTIGRVTDSTVRILSAKGSKFAAIEHNNLIYIHYQIAEQLNDIHEVLFTSPEKTHVVANNIAPLQPLAAAAMKDGFRATSVVETAGAKLRSINPKSTAVPTLGETRYTVYHGTDCYLWISYTWDTLLGPISVQQKVEHLGPDDLFHSEFSSSPLALIHSSQRLVLYYLNQSGQISRISLLADQGWGKPTIVGDSVVPLYGTNLSVRTAEFSPLLFHSFVVTYQDAECDIKTFTDRIIFNQPR